MMTKVNQIFIGKDISRTALIVADATLDTVRTNIVEGEIVVLSKTFSMLDTDATASDTDTIYIAEGTSEILSYYNEAGTSFSYRKLLLSSPIKAGHIKNYSIKAKAAKSEEVVTIPAITDTIVAGTEYVLRLVYRDLQEHPGQFTATYRYITKTGDTSQLIFNGFRTAIAKHTGRLGIKGGARIVATGTTTLILTAKPIPECTSSLANIDEFKMVNFDVFFNYVDSNYNWTEVGLASAITKTEASRGVGQWEVVRDLEKYAMGYNGISNRTHFPVIMPDLRTVKSASYNMITIEYSTPFKSADNQYDKSTDKSIIIAIPNASGTQYTNVSTILTSWLATA